VQPQQQALVGLLKRALGERIVQRPANAQRVAVLLDVLLGDIDPDEHGAGAARPDHDKRFGVLVVDQGAGHAVHRAASWN
jgi:hypothetical protein